MAKKTLKIEGMMCDNCTSKVEAALSKIPGVTSAVANYKKGTAIVEFTGDIPDETLAMAVIDCGFKAKVKHGLFR